MKNQPKKITFSLPFDLYEKLAVEAEKQSRSITGQLIYIVKLFFDDAT